MTGDGSGLGRTKTQTQHNESNCSLIVDMRVGFDRSPWHRASVAVMRPGGRGTHICQAVYRDMMQYTNAALIIRAADGMRLPESGRSA